MSAKFRQTLYLLGTVATSLVTLALTWGLVDESAANSVTQLVVAGLGLLGVGATATATAVVTKQKNEGQFDVVDPAQSVIDGVQAILQKSVDAAQDIEKVKQAVSDAVGVVPGVGPLSQQIIASANRYPIKPSA